MTASALKKQIHKAVDNIEDGSFLKAVYSILNEKSHEKEFVLSEEQKTMLDKREKLHKIGKSKSYTIEEVNTYLFSRIGK